MTQQNIAVIGGGPKAAAIATKAHCLRQIGFPISVTVFEQHVVGAAWNGTKGYTNGDQRLCTPAERDLGYPYDDVTSTAGVSELMLQRFSWPAFKVANGDDGKSFADWISRGRKPPFHREFASYLKWAVGESGTELQIGKVTEIRSEDGRWSVVYGAGGQSTVAPGFDGVVITGPGPAAKYFKKPRDKRVLDGVSFWSRLNHVRRLNTEGLKRAVIVGGGGTAAAVAAWLVQNCDFDNITILNSQPTLFTRTLNFFENRLFDDETSWTALSPDDRTAFTNRLNRGVVWESVTEILSNARQLALVPGRATSVETVNNGRGGTDLTVNYQTYDATPSLPADIVVDATGFDALWFRSLLEESLPPLPNEDQIRLSMKPDLSIDFPGPPLHVPMLSQVIGPGYASLMSLGLMADAILRPYIAASDT